MNHNFIIQLSVDKLFIYIHIKSACMCSMKNLFKLRFKLPYLLQKDNLIDFSNFRFSSSYCIREMNKTIYSEYKLIIYELLMNHKAYIGHTILKILWIIRFEFPSQETFVHFCVLYVTMK